MLSGGDSRRMGKDKGLLITRTERPAGETWAERNIRLLSPFVSETLVSVRREQAEAYRAALGEIPLVFDQGSGRGPLAGLLAAHRLRPASDLLLLACDMQRVTPALVRRLLDEREENPGSDALVYRRANGVIEPLLGYYSAPALAVIREQDDEKSVFPGGVRKILQEGNVVYLPLEPGEEELLSSFNAPEDLEEGNPDPADSSR